MINLLIYITVIGFLFILFAIMSILSDIRTNLAIINETLKEINKTNIRKFF